MKEKVVEEIVVFCLNVFKLEGIEWTVGVILLSVHLEAHLLGQHSFLEYRWLHDFFNDLPRGFFRELGLLLPQIHHDGAVGFELGQGRCNSFIDCVYFLGKVKLFVQVLDSANLDETSLQLKQALLVLVESLHRLRCKTFYEIVS